MDNKYCIVTGATRGLGLAAAVGLAKLGANVVIISRNQERVDKAVATIREKSAGGSVEGIRADLASLVEIRQAAEQYLNRHAQLDVLINNVGATLLQYTRSPEGMEMTWALNYLGHFLLTDLLLGALKTAAAQAGEARIIEVTSSMLRYANPARLDMQDERHYNGVLAYAQSKLALNIHTCELARRLTGSGVTINTVTPGAVRTNIAEKNGFFAKLGMLVVNASARPVEEGILPVLYLATSPEVKGVSGRYYRRFQVQAAAQRYDRPEYAARLREISERMAGLL